MEYPLQHSLEDKALIKQICNLYRRSVLSILPLMFGVLAIYHFTVVHILLPHKIAFLNLNLNMLLFLFILPLIGASIKLVYNKAQMKNESYTYVVYYGFARTLSLIGSLLSMLLLPLIVFGVSVSIYFLLVYYQAPFWSILLFSKIIPILLFTVSLTKIFAPFLVYTHQKSAAESIDLSDYLVKGYYLRTFIFSFFAFLMIIFLYRIDTLISLWPVFDTLSQHIKYSIRYGLLLLIAPWSIACIIMQIEDLQVRKKSR